MTFLNFRHPRLRQCITIFCLFWFNLYTIVPVNGSAQATPFMASSSLNLPPVGSRLTVTPSYTPISVKGITVHPDNPLQFDFILDTGSESVEPAVLASESKNIIKYFLAALTVPEEEMWVNLSPYEEDRLIPESFGQTEMGRDLLAQDYLLKQLTASLMYPEETLGEKFWDRVYTKVAEVYGHTDIPINPFHKVWIVPEHATVYQQGASAFVVNSRLKVMLDRDYVAQAQHNGDSWLVARDSSTLDEISTAGNIGTMEVAQIIRAILIPEIEREINEGQTFAKLRQMYQAMILANWYKINLQESLLGQVYVDQNKVQGIDLNDEQTNQKIYQQYTESFKKGVYDYIRQDYDSSLHQFVARKYFAGGVSLFALKDLLSKELIKDSDLTLRIWNSKQIRIVRDGLKAVGQYLHVIWNVLPSGVSDQSRKSLSQFLKNRVASINERLWDPNGVSMLAMAGVSMDQFMDTTDDGLDVQSSSSDKEPKVLRTSKNESLSAMLERLRNDSYHDFFNAKVVLRRWNSKKVATKQSLGLGVHIENPFERMEITFQAFFEKFLASPSKFLYLSKAQEKRLAELEKMSNQELQDFWFKTAAAYTHIHNYSVTLQDFLSDLSGDHTSEGRFVPKTYAEQWQQMVIDVFNRYATKNAEVYHEKFFVNLPGDEDKPKGVFVSKAPTEIDKIAMTDNGNKVLAIVEILRRWNASKEDQFMTPQPQDNSVGTQQEIVIDIPQLFESPLMKNIFMRFSEDHQLYIKESLAGFLSLENDFTVLQRAHQMVRAMLSQVDNQVFLFQVDEVLNQFFLNERQQSEGVYKDRTLSLREWILHPTAGGIDLNQVFSILPPSSRGEFEGLFLEGFEGVHEVDDRFYAWYSLLYALTILSQENGIFISKTDIAKGGDMWEYCVNIAALSTDTKDGQRLLSLGDLFVDREQGIVRDDESLKNLLLLVDRLHDVLTWHDELEQPEVIAKIQYFKNLLDKNEVRITPVKGAVDNFLNPTKNRQNVGGIDFNPALMDFKVKHDSNGIALPWDQQNVDDLMSIKGFVPMIIHMAPLPHMLQILGFADSVEPYQQTSQLPFVYQGRNMLSLSRKLWVQEGGRCV